MSILSDVDLAIRVRHYPRHRVRQTDSLEIYGALLTAGVFPSLAAFCGVYGFGSTFAPGASASWPVTTTLSSGSTPLSTTVRSPSWRCPGFTGRSSTVLSGFNTKTNGPLWLI